MKRQCVYYRLVRVAVVGEDPPSERRRLADVWHLVRPVSALTHQSHLSTCILAGGMRGAGLICHLSLTLTMADNTTRALFKSPNALIHFHHVLFNIPLTVQHFTLIVQEGRR